MKQRNMLVFLYQNWFMAVRISWSKIERDLHIYHHSRFETDQVGSGALWIVALPQPQSRAKGLGAPSPSLCWMFLNFQTLKKWLEMMKTNLDESWLVEFIGLMFDDHSFNLKWFCFFFVWFGAFSRYLWAQDLRKTLRVVSPRFGWGACVVFLMGVAKDGKGMILQYSPIIFGCLCFFLQL